MSNKVFVVYRNGWASEQEKLPGVIEQAAADFAERYNALPACLVINPQVANEARAALAGLGLAVEVKPIGGCLLGELWLALPASAEVPA